MNQDEQLFFKIEDYLQGKLSPQVAAAFEQEIAADPALAKLVELHRFERAGLEFMHAERLREKLKSWQTAPPPLEDLVPEGVKNASGRWKWWLSIPLVLIAGLLIFWVPKFINPKPVSPPPPGENVPPNLSDTTFQKNQDTLQAPENQPNFAGEEKKPEQKPPQTQPFDAALSDLVLATHDPGSSLDPVQLKGENGSAASPLEPIRAAMRQPAPDYPKVIAELSKFDPKRQPLFYDQARKLLAHAYFRNRQFDRAALIFEEMTRQDLSEADLDEAQWNLLLSLLPDLRRKNEAKKLLTEILDPVNEHDFLPDAVGLEKKLAERKW